MFWRRYMWKHTFCISSRRWIYKVVELATAWKQDMSESSSVLLYFRDLCDLSARVYLWMSVYDAISASTRTTPVLQYVPAHTCTKPPNNSIPCLWNRFPFDSIKDPVTTPTMMHVAQMLKCHITLVFWGLLLSILGLLHLFFFHTKQKSQGRCDRLYGRFLLMVDSRLHWAVTLHFIQPHRWQIPLWAGVKGYGDNASVPPPGVTRQ